MEYVLSRAYNLYIVLMLFNALFCFEFIILMATKFEKL